MTFKKRIVVSVALDSDGNWAAVGSSKLTANEAMKRAISQVNDGEKQVHLVADIEVPAAPRKEPVLPDTPNSGVPWE